MYSGIEEHKEEIAALCREYQVRELAVFGSVARGDFHANSDYDLLVEFTPDSKTGLLEFSGLQRRLQELLGRKVDLVPKLGLKPRIKDRVLSESQVIYAR